MKATTDRLRILHGDALAKLRELPGESVHLIVTSPPYWGLRDYKLPAVIWPRKAEGSATRFCRHEWEEHVTPAANGIIHDGGMSGETLNGTSVTRGPKKSDFCAKCNAWRGSLGLEPTPELYVEHLVAVLREGKRVLRKDGTLWLNLGDSYVSTAQGTMGDALHQRGILAGVSDRRAEGSRKFRPKMDATSRCKAGDLVGIPWRVAFALQADGWFLRRDNIWFKPNPMPESVNGWRWERHKIKKKTEDGGRRTEADWKIRPKGLQAGQGAHDKVANGNYRQNGSDQTVAEFIDCPGCEKCAPNGGLILRKGNWRCTTSHEYVFQFSRSASYFCDAEAAREKRDVSSIFKAEGPNSRMHLSRVPRDGNDKPNPSRSAIRSSGNKKRFIASKNGDRSRLNNHLGSGVPWTGFEGNRNRRSVWRIATKPYRDAHFATFPPDLVRPIILAATSPQVCADCGAPYAPVIERGEPRRKQQLACGSDKDGKYTGEATKDFLSNGAEDASAVKARILAGMVHKRVVGYRATCSCEPASTRPATVLDPFGGSGTVGQVAIEEGRVAVLIELAGHYLPLIAKRCGTVTPPLPVSVASAKSVVLSQ